ncbi:MAG: hypothetical protein MI924_18520 [Chloroflexales bacterium]|nr:hypothetical protein [Chloroflexales bacterium]
MESTSTLKVAPVRHLEWARLLIPLWTALVALGLFALFYQRGFDDPYITYRYADNLSAGRGFVYNVGERVLSTTTPLYALLLAGLGRIGLDVPLVSNAIGCLGLALSGLAFWRLGQVWRLPVAGGVGLLLYPCFSLLIVTLGAESILYITLILFGFLACAEERYRWAAVLLALAALTRADGLVAAGTGGLYILITRLAPVRSAWDRLCSWDWYARLPWLALLVYGAILLPWFVFATWYFGAPFPATLAAKQQQGQMALSRDFLTGLLGQVRAYWNLPFYQLHFGLAAIGLVYGIARQRHWLLIPAWCLLYAAAYTFLGVSGYFWYYAPLVAGFIALIGLGVAAVHRAMAHIVSRQWAMAGALLLLLGLLTPQLNGLATFRHTTDTRLSIYRATGEWIRDHTPTDASVGVLEVGIIGYYAQRQMIDFAGLIQPDVALQLLPDSTYEDAAIWVVQRYRPTYLVLQQGAFSRLEGDAAVQTACRVEASFQSPNYDGTLVVYKCHW